MGNERPADDRLIDERETRRICANASRTSIWRWSREQGFPKVVRIGPRRVGRWESEVRGWLDRNREGVAA